MERIYSIVRLKERQRKHHLAMMYRVSVIESYLDVERPESNRRNRNKMKFLPAGK